MFEIVSEHQFWTAVVIYWMFSAAVSSMPEPAPNGSAAYLWFYRFVAQHRGQHHHGFWQQDPRSEDHDGDPADSDSAFRFSLPGALPHSSRSFEHGRFGCVRHAARCRSDDR